MIRRNPILMVVVILVAVFVAPQNVWAYSDETHKAINRQAVVLLRDNQDQSLAQYSKLLKAGVNYKKKTFSIETILTANATWPDKYEKGVLFRGHFYSPVHNTNYEGGTSPTAKSQFIKHYSAAVTTYKKGNQYDGWTELGKALHYLGDLYAPHHVWNYPGLAKNDITGHTDCEGYFDCYYNFYQADSLSKPQADLYLGITDGFDYTAWYWANFTFEKSYDLGTEQWKQLNSSTKKYNYKLMAGECLPEAQRSAAAVIVKFMSDTEQIVYPI